MSDANSAPLTMSIAEYSRITGISEYSVRLEIAADRIPHRRVGKRGLIRILRRPALEQLGSSLGEPRSALIGTYDELVATDEASGDAG
jgi:hypothetical protein